MAAGGLRVLAFAYRDLPVDKKDFNADEVEKDLVFQGFAGILDPPRPEVKGALSMAKDAGIDVIIMTGDAALTTKAVAQKIGFSTKRIVTARVKGFQMRHAAAVSMVVTVTSPYS